MREEQREAIKRGTKRQGWWCVCVCGGHTTTPGLENWSGVFLALTRPGCGHEPRQLCFLSFCLARVAFSPSLPRFLSPSFTRTKPICSETRVTGGVDKPCSCALPRDPHPPTHTSQLPFFPSLRSALSFSTQLLRPYRAEERCEMSALRLCGTSFLSHACAATMH